MARPKGKYPTPGKRKRGDSWQVFWRSGGTVYGISAGKVSEREAEARRLEVALALHTGEWPAWTEGHPAVVRYLSSAVPAGDVLAEYESGLRAEVGENWAATSLAHLRELKEVSHKPLVEVTSADAQHYLERILSTPGSYRKAGVRSAGTRNRALAACSRFYRWAVRTERLRSNPFRDVGRIAEKRRADIVYLTRQERDAVLEAADGCSDGLAVWLACYAGLRRSEVARLRWDDVRLPQQRLVVRSGKTGGRALPLASVLQAQLEARGGKRTGRVVPWQAMERKWQWRARKLVERLQRECEGVEAGRIGWNPFRHTFATLLAQDGVSLDKISAWMGNSPTVCRRHYAEFVPRGRRDEDIERL